MSNSVCFPLIQEDFEGGKAFCDIDVVYGSMKEEGTIKSLRCHRMVLAAMSESARGILEEAGEECDSIIVPGVEGAGEVLKAAYR